MLLSTKLMDRLLHRKSHITDYLHSIMMTPNNPITRLSNGQEAINGDYEILGGHHKKEMFYVRGSSSLF